MDLSHGHFYKTIERLKQLLNNIPKNIMLFVWIVSNDYNFFYLSRIAPWRINKNFFRRESSPTNKKSYSSEIIPNK